MVPIVQIISNQPTSGLKPKKEVGFVTGLLTTDSHVKMTNFAAELHVFTSWYKKTVSSSIVTLDIHDNSNGGGFFLCHIR